LALTYNSDKDITNYITLPQFGSVQGTAIFTMSQTSNLLTNTVLTITRTSTTVASDNLIYVYKMPVKFRIGDNFIDPSANNRVYFYSFTFDNGGTSTFNMNNLRFGFTTGISGYAKPITSMKYGYQNANMNNSSIVSTGFNFTQLFGIATSGSTSNLVLAQGSTDMAIGSGWGNVNLNGCTVYITIANSNLSTTQKIYYKIVIVSSSNTIVYNGGSGGLIDGTANGWTYITRALTQNQLVYPCFCFSNGMETSTTTLTLQATSPGMTSYDSSPIVFTESINILSH
jgi:hypothetical protein